MMYELFTIHVWFSIAGGAVGGVRSFYDSKGEKRPIGEIGVDFVISIIAAVAVNSYLLKPDLISPFVYLGFGVLWGACSRVGLRIMRSGAINYLKTRMDGLMASIVSALATNIARAQEEKKSDNEE